MLIYNCSIEFWNVLAVFEESTVGSMLTQSSGKVNPGFGYAYEDFQFGFTILDFDSGWPTVVS